MTRRPSGPRLPLATLGALGVVFGDIGTSPLYALRTAFSMEHNAVDLATANVYGMISMVLWTITLVVTLKYVLLVTRADNHGQGGILALLGLIRTRLGARRGVATVTALAMVGAALFFGDSVITPAISVLSAVEGLSAVSPALTHWVVPAAAVILAALFTVQPFGTGKVGRALGPIMFGWFITLALLGIPPILEHPQILVSLSPHWAVALVLHQPFEAFVLLGAIVLTVTGAEALYADLGLFGARAVRLAWFAVVMPALMLVYLGQGALVISVPEAAESPLFHLAPPALRIPLVVFATLATVVASQAVIAGAFSVTRQAIRLGLLPRLVVKYTSKSDEEQVYLPAVNWTLFAAVMTLVVVFASSARLANAYGLAVTGTLLLESGIFLLFAVVCWHWRWWKVGAYILGIGLLECLLLAANTTKLLLGGWLPLLLATVVLLIMLTWQRGYEQVSKRRAVLEGPFSQFVDSLSNSSIARTPGVAVFPHPNAQTAPLAMLQCVQRFSMLQREAVIVRVLHEHRPHVRLAQRFAVDTSLQAEHGITRVDIRTGFMDRQDIPLNLSLVARCVPEIGIDFSDAVYFLSVLTLHSPHPERYRHWRRRLFVALEKNQASRAETFQLPPARTVVLGTELTI